MSKEEKMTEDCSHEFDPIDASWSSESEKGVQLVSSIPLFVKFVVHLAWQRMTILPILLTIKDKPLYGRDLKRYVREWFPTTKRLLQHRGRLPDGSLVVDTFCRMYCADRKGQEFDWNGRIADEGCVEIEDAEILFIPGGGIAPCIIATEE